MTRSHINGTGYGSSHTWRFTDQVGSSTLYNCIECGAKFRHDYNVTPDIFKAIQEAGIPDKCLDKCQPCDGAGKEVVAIGKDEFGDQVTDTRACPYCHGSCKKPVLDSRQPQLSAASGETGVNPKPTTKHAIVQIEIEVPYSDTDLEMFREEHDNAYLKDASQHVVLDRYACDTAALAIDDRLVKFNSARMIFPQRP